MKIIKRSGQEVTFDVEKIYNAVAKANAATTGARELTPGQIREISDHVEAMPPRWAGPFRWRRSRNWWRPRS